MTTTTYEKRIAADGIRMTATSVTRTPPKWAQPDMDGWRCVLRGYGRTFTVTFWMGAGHHGRKPETEEVLECVLSDASIVTQYDSVDEFQQAMGYENGRQAEQVFMACRKQTERLGRWLGDQMDAWLYETANL